MKMSLNHVHSVAATGEAGVYLLNVNLTDIAGETYDCDYVSRPDDAFGLAPTIRAWLDENLPSTTVDPYTPPTVEEMRAALPPLTARQLRLGLIANDIMPSQVQGALEAMVAGTDRERALVEWEYASSFERGHHLIATVAASLGLTDEQVDAMWLSSLTL